MKKSQRIARLVAALPAGAGSSLDPRYLGYFTCFNAGQYYEAHDVLEDLWLVDRADPESVFYKGLIQFAGAFVHLKKQSEWPLHPKHRERLAPAARLFKLAAKSLQPFAPNHRQLSIERVRGLCSDFSARIAASNFLENPWNPGNLPQLELDSAGS